MEKIILPEVSAPFTRLDVMDRVEGILLTRYAYTSFTHWNMEASVREAVIAGLFTAAEASEVKDEYCKFLAIASTIDQDVKPTGKVKALWFIHRGTKNYTDMCKANGCTHLVNPTNFDRSVKELYGIVFAQLPAVWK